MGSSELCGLGMPITLKLYESTSLLRTRSAYSTFLHAITLKTVVIHLAGHLAKFWLSLPPLTVSRTLTSLSIIMSSTKRREPFQLRARPCSRMILILILNFPVNRPDSP